MTNNTDLESMLKQYLNEGNGQKGGDPASTPQSGPVVLPGLAGNITANSLEEAQRILAQQNAEILQYVENQNAQLRALQSQLETKPTSTPAQTSPNLEMGAPTSGVNPLEFVEKLVGNPTEVIGEQVLQHPAIKKKLEDIDRIQKRLTWNDFAQRHPLWNNPNVLQVIEKVRETQNLEANPENYEMIANHLVMQQVLPHEEVIRQHQRAMFAQQMKQSEEAMQSQGQAQGQTQGYINQGVNPNYNPPNYNPGIPMSRGFPQMAAGYMMGSGPVAPPPSSGVSQGSMGMNTEEALMKAAPMMSSDDLKKAIEMQYGGNG